MRNGFYFTSYYLYCLYQSRIAGCPLGFSLAIYVWRISSAYLIYGDCHDDYCRRDYHLQLLQLQGDSPVWNGYGYLGECGYDRYCAVWVFVLHFLPVIMHLKHTLWFGGRKCGCGVK